MPALLEEIPFFRELSEEDFSSIKERLVEKNLPKANCFLSRGKKGRERGQGGFWFRAQNSDLKARLEGLTSAKEALARR